jgi:L-erythro-3,5-diaminohexanoate dehydrogenase
VLEPKGALPQAAAKLANTPEIYSNEMLIHVDILNITSTAFSRIKRIAGGDKKKIKDEIKRIVEEKGKFQCPETGSGGMLIGTVAHVGGDLETDLKAGDKIATLVSLSLTPLKIEKILKVHTGIDRVDIVGQAVLFESGIYAVLPTDMSEALALAALDVAGAPAQVRKLVKEGDSVFILGGAGKSGMLCCYEAKKRVGKNGRVVALVVSQADADTLREMDLADDVFVGSATLPAETLEKALAHNDGREYDISINCVNVQNTEMASILPVKNGGKVYFFSMATSFTKAALGAEGVGKDVDMLIGNGYTQGHAKITLDIIRESAALRKFFEKKYV